MVGLSVGASVGAREGDFVGFDVVGVNVGSAVVGGTDGFSDGERELLGEVVGWGPSTGERVGACSNVVGILIV